MAPSSAKLWPVALILGALVLVSYAWSMNAPFQLDDSHSIQNNGAIRRINGILGIWIDPSTSSILRENRVYRPLSTTANALCWIAGQGKPWPFRVLKISLHWASCLLVFLIWARLFAQPGWHPTRAGPLDARTAAALPAILLAVHPAVSETVLYISATSSLLCAALYLLAFWLYLCHRESRDGRYLAGALVSYFFSVMAKEEGITLPALILLTELFLGSGGSASIAARAKSAIQNAWPYLAAGAAFAAFLVRMYPPEGADSRQSVTPYDYFVTQLRAYPYYQALWLWPWGLNADNVDFSFSHSLRDPLVIQGILKNAILLSIAWVWRKSVPTFLYGVLWFYVTIAPASSFIPLSEPVNEHRTYLAYVGFAGGILALAFRYLAEPMRASLTRRRLSWVFGAILLGLWVGTHERNRVWSSSENLWADTVEKNPGSGRAANNLALVYMGRAEYGRALELLDHCERVWPTYGTCSINRGVTLAAQGNFAGAENAFQRALVLTGGSTTTNFFVGRFYADSKRDDSKALTYLAKADELAGGRHLEAQAKMVEVYVRQGKMGAARRVLDRMRELEPGNPELARLAQGVP